MTFEDLRSLIGLVLLIGIIFGGTLGLIIGIPTLIIKLIWLL